MEIAITKNKIELERLEKIIQKNLQSFYEVGRALMEIRDQGYYRDVLGYQTFEEYCRVKWDFTRQHAYRFIDSAKVVDNVTDRLQTTPANLEQTRPLARLAPEQQKEAWQRAVETAPEGKVTAAHVYKIVKGMAPQQPPREAETPQPQRPCIPEHAIYFATIAISQLERISNDDPTKEEALSMVEEWINQKRTGGN